MRFVRTALLVLALLGTSSAAAAQGVTVFGFSDISYVATTRDEPDGFVDGQLVGHVSAGLTERLAFFGELTATGRPAGFGVEVERMILRYDVADYLKVSAGRYHTPLGYWNAAYHHGLWLQPSVARPQMIRFGSSFIPVHFVGMLVEGSFPAHPLGPGYFGGVGNGRHEHIARAGDAGDVNERRAWLAGIRARPPALYGLQAGVAVYTDRIDLDSGAAVDERILSAHLAWDRAPVQLIAEYARVAHDPVRGAGGPAVSHGYYAQAGYRLPGALSALQPYVRLERNDAASEDPVFDALDLDYEGVVAGLRYDFAPLAALKGEYRRERFGASERAGALYLQVSFTFPAPGGSP